MAKQFVPIIGMEIHVEPTTESKMFCECPAEFFGVEPNLHTCPVCLGLPGALPIPNMIAIEKCVQIGLALGCSINKRSKFDRKNYFYPDLPKAYQISQYDLPFAVNGTFKFPHHESVKDALNWDEVGITRVHMEEDTGKLSHQTVDGEKVSLVDYNRSGLPLIEIVTEPDIRSAAQAKQFLKWLARTIQWLGISSADMEKGQMRLEANISVAETEDGVVTELPSYKVEVKNVNSFRYIERAIEFEIERHIALLKSGETPKQETRGFAEDRGETFSQRSKEEAQDYRYFPDPDIPPIVFSDRDIESLRNKIVSTPVEAITQLVELGIRPDYADVIGQSLESYTVFTAVSKNLPKLLTPEDAAKLLVNKKVELAGTEPNNIIEILKSSIKTYSTSEGDIEAVVRDIMANNSAQVAEYQAGKVGLLGYFVGQVMQQTKGQADPKIVNEIIRKLLES